MKTWAWLMIVLAVFLGACRAQSNHLNVEMTEFGFHPDRMTVKAGAAVTLDLKNSGALEHDFLILENGEQAHTPFKEGEAHIYWKTHLDAREQATLQFTAPSKPGEYRVVCGVPGHLEQKMAAILVVTP